MQLIKQNEQYDCITCTVAMLLDIEPSTVVKEIGHDGSEIIWPKQVYKIQKRGYHIQEMMDLFYRRNKLLVPIELIPTIGPYNSSAKYSPFEVHFKHIDNESRFLSYIHNRNGILMGEAAYNQGAPHAVAWIDNTCYDPNGYIYDVEDFYVRECWIVIPIS